MIKLARRFKRDRRATIAIITALVIFPMLFLAIGTPIDLARAVQLRSAVQNNMDADALAGEEDIANGATAGQACTMAYTFAIDEIVAQNGVPNGFATQVTTAPGTSCGTTPQTSPSTAPNSVTVSASSNLPATFTSYLQKNLPITASATATGPQGFITICVQPHVSGSADLNQAYYYLKYPNGFLYNQDGSIINQADSPGQNTGPGSPLPSSTSGVELSAFLADNHYPTANGPQSANTKYCDAADTQVAVTIKSGLGQRLGFLFTNITGAQIPCYYASGNSSRQYACLTTNANYAYLPTTSTNTVSGGNAAGFFNYYTTYGIARNTWYPNAYGSSAGELNLFYSTDYPNSYYTNNLSIVNSVRLSPSGINTCYDTLIVAGLVVNAINGYSPASQGCLLSQTPTPIGGQNVSADSAATVIFGFNNSGATNTLVCLVRPGSNQYNGTAYVPALTTDPSGNQHVTGSNGANVQQENMIIANSSTTNGSLGSSVYQCPVNTVGNPYYPAPTCAELAGATLQVGWNDMGGVQNDNGNSPDDLFYSYSCAPVDSTTVTETALTQ